MEIKNNYDPLFDIKNKIRIVINNLKYIFLFVKLNLFFSYFLKI